MVSYGKYSGWGKVSIHFVMLLIFVNNKLYFICFVVLWPRLSS